MQNSSALCLCQIFPTLFHWLIMHCLAAWRHTRYCRHLATLRQIRVTKWHRQLVSSQNLTSAWMLNSSDLSEKNLFWQHMPSGYTWPYDFPVWLKKETREIIQRSKFMDSVPYVSTPVHWIRKQMGRTNRWDVTPSFYSDDLCIPSSRNTSGCVVCKRTPKKVEKCNIAFHQEHLLWPRVQSTIKTAWIRQLSNSQCLGWCGISLRNRTNFCMDYA